MAQEHISKLSSPPLQEVIFELRWALEIDDTNHEHDSKYWYAIGVFRNAIKDKFPEVEKKIPDSTPINLYPYVPRCRFKPLGKDWPTIQIGPGVLSINESGQDYDWKSFKQHVIQGLDALEISYEQLPNGIVPSLRYIDVIAIPDEVEDIYGFIAENFHLKIARSTVIPGKQSDFRFGEWHVLDDGTNLQMLFSTAIRQHDNQRSLVWQSTATSIHLSTYEDLIAWIENAHSVTSQLFRDIVTQSLYEKFR